MTHFNPFLIGFIFGGIYELVKVLRLQSGHQRPPAREALWSLLVGIPSFLAFSFSAGVVIAWGADSTKNHTWPFFLVILLWIVTLVLEGFIEKLCYPKEKAMWNDSICLRSLLIAVVFMLSLILAILPYVFYKDETGINVWDSFSSYVVFFAFIAVFALVFTIIFIIHKRDETHALSIIKRILCSFVAPQAPKFYGDDSLLDQMLSFVVFEQVAASAKLVARHRGEVANFTAERDGMLHPGLEDIRVPRHRLIEITKKVKEQQAKSCDIILRMADILIASDLQADEGAAWLSEHATIKELPEPIKAINDLRRHREVLKRRSP